jgi:hypothetical protein
MSRDTRPGCPEPEHRHPLQAPRPQVRGAFSVSGPPSYPGPIRWPCLYHVSSRPPGPPRSGPRWRHRSLAPDPSSRAGRPAPPGRCCGPSSPSALGGWRLRRPGCSRCAGGRGSAARERRPWQRPCSTSPGSCPAVAPFGPTNTRPSAPSCDHSSKCARSSGTIASGIATSRRPAVDFGGHSTSSPPTSPNEPRTFVSVQDDEPTSRELVVDFVPCSCSRS